jgi:FAD/FMN-containing dehydrogenase
MRTDQAAIGVGPGRGVTAGTANRRGFLALGAAVGAGALVTAGRGLGVAGPAASAARGPRPRDWEALRARISSHKLIRPTQRGYNVAKELFDPRFDSKTPAAVAYCGTPQDVGACVNFARMFRMPICARSGGHGYGGWSSVNNGLIVDVTLMNSFAVGNGPVGEGTVRVGAGTFVIDLYDHLAPRGLAVPGGSCPTVGIAGLTLGGGVGVLSRIYGLTSDNLESVQIVTADGIIRTCDARHNSDLFWACRGGGGGNFGIATSFTLRTHQLSRVVLFYLTWPWSQAARVVAGWQSWAPYQPDALWSNLHLIAPAGFGTPSVSVGGTYVGGTSGAASLLTTLYRRIGHAPSTTFLNSEPYLSAMLVEAGCASLSVNECHLPGQAPGGSLPRVPQYAKSDFFTRPLNAAGIRALVGGIEQLRGVRGAAGGGGALAFDAFGGALNRVSPSATAFVHRNALFLAQYTTSWNWPGSSSGAANQHAWLRSYYASVHPYASGQAYQNYIDPDLTNWPQAYYGANYARLQQVKRKYDPHQLFNFPQAITP